MPCNGDYLNATDKELQLSRVACLLDELAGKPFTKGDWAGYHPRVYSQHLSTAEADYMVDELCAKLSTRDVTAYSLEMQLWWRDHQQADMDRMLAEQEQSERERNRQAALSKLTPEERRLLGVKSTQ